jgi:hypothetical protein
MEIQGFVLERLHGAETEYLDLDTLRWDRTLTIMCLLPCRTYARRLAHAQRGSGVECWVRELQIKTVGSKDEKDPTR